jgi:hypothetical protein
MKLSSVAAVTVVLAASAAWAQSASPSMASHASRSNPRTVMATSNATGLAQNQQAQTAIHQRVDDMGSTLVKMHALLKQMEAKNKNGASKDPMIKANLEMWGLMLQDLDKQYEQLRLAARTREDMEARRAAMYKQAEAKAAAEAQGLQAPGFARTPAKGAAQGAAPGAAAFGSPQATPPSAPAAQPAQTPAPAPASSSQSPN